MGNLKILMYIQTTPLNEVYTCHCLFSDLNYFVHVVHSNCIKLVKSKYTVTKPVATKD